MTSFSQKPLPLYGLYPTDIPMKRTLYSCVATLSVPPVQLTLPPVEGLRGPAIRPRRWKQVLRLACVSSLASLQLIGRGGGLDSCVLENLTLCQLMSLELHSQSILSRPHWFGHKFWNCKIATIALHTIDCVNVY